ncbi:acylaminoacyl-peptidase [Stipitochalara longipes BDJ]|nr:acylaminoacyl-peptidase [Stipitochalara longipes BDJ]
MRTVDQLSSGTSSPKRPDYTQQDIRKTALWSEVDDYLNKILSPSIDQVSGANDLAASPDGSQIAFTGTITPSDWRSAPSKTRICLLSTSGNTLETITAGPNSEHLPKWSPDGKMLGFLSDRKESGIFQLYLLKYGGLGESKPLPSVKGIVEDFHWGPDGKRILLHVAGRLADRSDADGSGNIGTPKDKIPAWMPSVDYGDLSEAWRSLWIYDLATQKLKRVNGRGGNPWEVAWRGSNSIVSIASDMPSEDAWYTANLRIKDLDDEIGKEKILYVPKRQLALPTASPSGDKIAVLEALASDRKIVAGDIMIVDSKTGTARRVPAQGVDVTQIIWRDEKQLFYIGLRGPDAVASQYPVQPSNPIWEYYGHCGDYLPTATLLPGNDIAVVLGSWTKAPEVAIVSSKEGSMGSRTLLSFGHSGYESLYAKLGPMHSITWHGADGLTIQGFLHLPKNPIGKVPLIVSVHGGPIYANLNTSASVSMTTFLNLKGYAVFRPNPRGSAGWGQAFAEAVLGDMGGADAQDILSGITAVCDTHPDLIDAEKIGLIGGSYGGFMASLLPTLSPIFKASVSMAAVTDWHSFHTTTNIPSFDKLFLDDDPFSQKGGRYLERSPVMNVGKYKTPVLQTAGIQDAAVPHSQAVQYHKACLEKGVESAIVLYPGEGHGVKAFPAVIDQFVRSMAWLEKFVPV